MNPSQIASRLVELGVADRIAYLATPYAAHPYGLAAATCDAARHAAELMTLGVRVFSPIAHGHPIAMAGRIPPESHEFWLAQDEPFMEAAAAMIAVRLPGWDKSTGMAWERAWFAERGKPVLDMEALP